MAQSALDILTQAVHTNPCDILTIYSDSSGGISVSWSDMPVERLVYLKEILNAGVSSKIIGAERPQAQAPAPIRKKKASEAPRAT